MADLSDKTDDIAIWNEGRTKAVTITTDGSKERLDVNALVVGSLDTLAQDGKAWSCNIDTTVIAGTSETPFFLLKNPTGSGIRALLLELLYSGDGNTTIIRLYRDPTITANGTALTASNYVKGGAAPVSTIFKSPTISAMGTLLRVEYSTNKVQTTFDQALIRAVAANENFLLTVQSSNNKQHFLALSFGETV